jgi:hypothetical protein
MAVTYIFLSSVHVVPSPQDLIVDFNRCRILAEITLDVVASTGREEEERCQWAFGSIGVLLLLWTLLLLLARRAGGSIEIGAFKTRTREVVSQGMVDGLWRLARRGEQLVGVAHVGADESGDGAVELGETGDDCVGAWLAGGVLVWLTSFVSFVKYKAGRH